MTEHSHSSRSDPVGQPGFARKLSASNGNGQPHGGPKAPPYQAYAGAIVRLILGRRIAPKTRKALAESKPPEWGDLAQFVEDSRGLSPEQLWGQVRRQYV